MANKYWVGGGASSNWDATGNTNWSDTDGGANNATIPTTGDDVFLKSAANCVVNVATASLNSFNMTGYSGTLSGSSNITVAPSTGTVICKFAGTVTWDGNLLLNPASPAFINLTSGGNTLDNCILNAAGQVTQQDNLTSSGYVEMLNGIWDTNDFNISAIYISAKYASEFYFANSTLTCSQSLAANLGFECLSPNTSITSSTIILTGSGKFIGGGISYNIVTLQGDNPLEGSNTFATLNINNAGTAGTGVVFSTASWQNITTLTTNGSLGNKAKISTGTLGAYFVKDGGGTITLTYTDIDKIHASPVNSWYAGGTCTLTNSTGWNDTPVDENLYINSWTDLLAASELTLTDPTKNYTLNADLDNTQDDYTGIGDVWYKNGGSLTDYPFEYYAGIFEGNNHTISDLIADPGNNISYLGLFSEITTGTVQNLGILNAEITGAATTAHQYNIGILTAYLSDYGATITNCFATGTISVTGTGYIWQGVGGLVGQIGDYAVISDSWANVTITLATSGIGRVEAIGGLVGFCYAVGPPEISNCYATVDISGTITAGRINYTGGLIGWIDEEFTVTKCYSTGTIGGSVVSGYWDYVGGLIGYMDNNTIDINNCYSTVDISGAMNEVGGLVGYVDDYDIAITNCYATGDCHSTLASGSPIVAGLVADWYPTSGLITNSYSTGKVTCTAASKIYISGVAYLDNNADAWVNCGWYKDPAGDATYGDPGNSQDPTYVQAKSWFYDKTANIYDTQSPVWDFSTPVWYEQPSDFPLLEGTGPANISKISGVAWSSVSKVSGVESSSIGKILGVD